MPQGTDLGDASQT